MWRRLVTDLLRAIHQSPAHCRDRLRSGTGLYRHLLTQILDIEIREAPTLLADSNG